VFYQLLNGTPPRKANEPQSMTNDKDFSGKAENSILYCSFTDDIVIGKRVIE
tara:strand:- start:353 stop:508 length:156 start_codon:yes stop_codon:yes gene_type:complete